MATPKEFPEQNGSKTKPKGEEYNAVGTLPVKTSITEMEDGQKWPTITSCWQLSPAEIEEIKRTGEVWLRVYSNQQPIVSVFAGNPFTPRVTEEVKPEPKEDKPVSLITTSEQYDTLSSVIMFNLCLVIHRLRFEKCIGGDCPYPGYAGGAFDVRVETMYGYKYFLEWFNSREIKDRPCTLRKGSVHRGEAIFKGCTIESIPNREGSAENGKFEPGYVTIRFLHLSIETKS